MSRSLAPFRSHRRTSLQLRAVIAASIVLGLVAAAACSDPPTTDAERPTDGEKAELPECDLEGFDEAVAEGDGPIEIDLWYGELIGALNLTIQRLAENFNKSQDDVVVTAHDQGQDYSEVFRKFESASASDQLPEAIYLQAEDFAAVVDSGRVLPAQACMEAAGYDLTDIEALARNYYSRDGVLYSAYMNTSNPVLYYNRNHWTRAGLDPEEPPTTLDELYDQAKTLKEEGVSEKPFALMLDRWFFVTWLNGIGADVVDKGNGRNGDPTEATFATDETRELLTFLKKMEDEGLLQAFPDEEGSIDQYIAVAGQESSMLVGTSAAAGTLRDTLAGDLTAEDIAGGAGTEQAGDVDLSGIVPVSAQFPGIEEPGQVYPTGGAFYLMNTADPVDQVAAWKFMEFMLQPENAQEWMINGGYVPVVKAVQDEPETEAFLEEDVAGALVVNAVEQMQAVDPDKPGPAIGPYTDFTTAIEQMLQAIFFDDADIDDALETAESNVTASLERYYG